MKRKFLIAATSVITLFSVFTVFSKPNPNSASSLFNKKDYKVESYGKDPGATPEVVKARLEALNSEIEMTYNSTVQADIDQYLKHGRTMLSRLLVLSSYYMPIFERALQEAGLPDELKCLPIIESGLEPRATSNKGAGGLWQFMPCAARGYDMKITSSIDERCDPYLSSKRACKMLKDLYDMFGDWGLALAAYNAGPGTIKNAIRRAGGGQHTFWTLINYLPQQTRRYVPKFIAMNYVMNYYTEHNIPAIAPDNALATDTVHIKKSMRLSQVASAIGVGIDQLRTLNPHFRSDVIPGTDSRHCNLILPAEKVRDFKAQQGLPYDENSRMASVSTRSSRPAAGTASARVTAANGDEAYTKVKDSKRPTIDPHRFKKPSTE